MTIYDPHYTNTIMYPEVGTVLIVDKCSDGPCDIGWQRVWNVSTKRKGFVHPAILRRIRANMQCLGIEHITGESFTGCSTENTVYVDVFDLGGPRHIKQHIGTCRLIVESKLEGDLIGFVARGLSQLWHEEKGSPAMQSSFPQTAPRNLCFFCSHGKHRSRCCQHVAKVLTYNSLYEQPPHPEQWLPFKRCQSPCNGCEIADRAWLQQLFTKHLNDHYRNCLHDDRSMSSGL